MYGHMLNVCERWPFKLPNNIYSLPFCILYNLCACSLRVIHMDNWPFKLPNYNNILQYALLHSFQLVCLLTNLLNPIVSNLPYS